MVDVRRTVDLLFGVAEDRPGLTVPRIVAAAVELADADGLEALSMRRLAERLGFTTMSLYRHVPGRAELVELMRDAAFGELSARDPAEAPAGDWRAGLQAWARTHWELHLRHPWLVTTDGSRRLPGPHTLADYDHALACAEGTGLRPSESAQVVALLAGFVLSAARQAHDVLREERESGVSHVQWWHGQNRLVERMVPYPAIARYGMSGAFDEPEDPFDFGLACTLDGVEAMVRRRHRTTASGDGLRDEKSDARREPETFRNDRNDDPSDSDDPDDRDGRTGAAPDAAEGDTAEAATGSPHLSPPRCDVCATAVPAPARGRPRRYCSRACRQRAYRRRARA
ncbi:TetR/AcrR family transcriptional regulator [Streptomyces sp. NBC_01497]|uniref:TetR/AcrR family transcriptional regulator n=1 Tax=Streptomyces sp. NBC_01497 TaxID=2903885 RepID=UPI002E2F5E86|nr:TetR/AcrR family transcriptional regulator [Streptomyces sp. NBC_01497]